MLEISVILFSDEDIPLFEPVINLMFNTIFFYVSYYFVFPKDEIKIDYINIFARFLLSIIFALLVKWAYTFLLDQFGLINLYRLSNVKFFIISNVYRFILFTAYAGFIWFFTTRIKMQKLILLNEIKREKIQKDLAIAEYAILKSRINPHFLFNTLSFIYSKASISSDEIVSRSILLLSDVLRYSLQENKNNQMVPINKEIEYICKLSEINNLRFNGNYFVKISNKGSEHNKSIPQYIILTLFENTLKHGDYQSIDHPIAIDVFQYSNKIIIQVKNRIRNKSSLDKMDSFKIGQQYIYKILEEFYKDKYNLQIEIKDGIFAQRLTIYTND